MQTGQQTIRDFYKAVQSEDFSTELVKTALLNSFRNLLSYTVKTHFHRPTTEISILLPQRLYKH